MDFLHAGDELVVVKLDRLGRSTRDVLNLVHELEAKGGNCGLDLASLPCWTTPWVRLDRARRLGCNTATQPLNPRRSISPQPGLRSRGLSRRCRPHSGLLLASVPPASPSSSFPP